MLLRVCVLWVVASTARAALDAYQQEVQSLEGKLEANDCPVGAFFNEFTRRCSECVPGYRQTRTGCEECAEDEYQERHGQAYCRKCPHGLVSMPGASVCFNATRSAAAEVAQLQHNVVTAKRCSHITCQYNGNHLQVRHAGAERHGMAHHCFYHELAPSGNTYQRRGDCVCMCAEHSLGDDLYMLIPHGSRHELHRKQPVWHLDDRQYAALVSRGFSLPESRYTTSTEYHEQLVQRETVHRARTGGLGPHWTQHSRTSVRRRL
eukprot:g4459.t1